MPTSQSGSSLRKSHVDFHEINRAALPAMRPILNRILLGGRYEGREYVVLNPRRSDKNAGSFKINVATGRWADFATGDKGGDPISLIAYLERVKQSAAARLLARMLGLDVGGRHHG